MMAWLLTILICLAVPTPVNADSWFPEISPHNHLPPLFMVVDKGQQQATLVRRAHNATRLERFENTICSTGKADGDKQVQGDLKTPEGIYFITGKISSGLEFIEYGNTAFPLNYPNPVDRLRGKTGYGIWIHGRGVPLTPKMTRGCVSLPNVQVDRLDKHLALHKTPIIIGQGMTWGPAADNLGLREVMASTRAWAWAKEQRHEYFFNLYHPQLFARSSGQSFVDFQARIRAEFVTSPEVDLDLGQIQILEGPGYLLSFFTEQISTHSRTQAGWRRLYWMTENKVWKIVGEEWIPLALEDALP